MRSPENYHAGIEAAQREAGSMDIHWNANFCAALRRRGLALVASDPPFDAARYPAGYAFRACIPFLLTHGWPEETWIAWDEKGAA